MPQLLLLDEVDAMLHPKMCVALIKSLQNVFSENLKIPTIVVSHSVSTVAAAPSDGLYMLDRKGHSVTIQRRSKEDVVDLLSQGIVAYTEKKSILSIDYRIEQVGENASIVLVEGSSDAVIFKNAWPKLKKDDSLDLVFLEYGAAGSLMNILNGHRIPGAISRVVGIFDRDKKGYRML